MKKKLRILLVCTVIVVTGSLFCLAGSLTSPEALVLNVGQKENILGYTRALLAGSRQHQEINILPDIRRLENPVILGLFSSAGEFLGSVRVDQPESSLPQRIAAAVSALKKNLPPGPVDLNNTYIHVMLVGFTGRFANFGVKGFFGYKVYQPRVTGLVYEMGDKRAELNPLECLVMDLDSKTSRAYLAHTIGMDPKKMPQENDLTISVYRVVHFAERFPDRKTICLNRGHRVFTAADVDAKSIRESIELVGKWYKNNVHQGQVTYEYNPTTLEYRNDKRTMVRSTLAVWILNRLAYFLNDAGLKESGKECIDFYLKEYFQMPRSLKEGKIIPSQEPVGERENLIDNRYTCAGILISAILERDDSRRYRKEIDLLSRWLMGHQKGDGTFPTQYGLSQYFMPGQVMLSISHLYQKTRNESYRKFFDKSFDIYAKFFKDMATLAGKAYTPYAPAWFTQPFAKMYFLTGEEKYRDMVYLINDPLTYWYENYSQRPPYYDYDGALAPKAGYYGNVSITAAALESLVDAWEVARIDGDTRRMGQYAGIIRHTVAYLIRLQYVPENTYYVRQRDRVIGAFKYDLVHNEVWMDNVWHLTGAFMKIVEYGIFPKETGGEQ